MIRFVLLSTAQLLYSTSCNAQTWNDSYVEDCPSPISTIVNGNHPFNSTGMVRLAPDSTHDDPWYLSLTITDRRNPQYIYGDSATWQQLEGFLSIPNSLAGSEDGSQTKYCMYMLPSRNAGTQEEAGSCSGVVSDECIAALRENTPAISDSECHRPDNLEAACGAFAPMAMNYPKNFSSSECTLTGLPHIDLPNDYRTYGYLPVSTFQGGDDRENFDLYDQHVREAVPMVLTVRAPDGAVETKVICLVPNNVVEGSRGAEESAASRSSSGAVLGITAAVVALMSILVA